MADSYVCSGAIMRCTMGTSQAKLTVLPIRTVFLTGQPMANISDHVSFVNLAPFGRCRSLGFPATASATAAHHGHLTPMPCMHNTPFPWMDGKNDYIIKGDPALLKSSTCACMWGGTISLVTDGQNDTGPADMSKKAKEKFKNEQKRESTSNTNKEISVPTGGAASVEGNAPRTIAPSTTTAVKASDGSSKMTPDKLLQNALKYKGKSYSMQNRTGPNSFDCSGLIQVATGMETWTTSDTKTILKYYDKVDSNPNKMALKDPKEMDRFMSTLQKGDVLVWDPKYGHKCSKAGTGHVVIYNGTAEGMTFEARGRNGVNYYNDLKRYWLVDSDYGYPVVYRLKP